MRFDVITLFPDSFAATLASSIWKRALVDQRIEIHFHNPREEGEGPYKAVDDSPYGGGAGMLMRADVLLKTFQRIPVLENRRVIFLSPQGCRLSPVLAEGFATEYSQIVLICGHYEGVDERFIQLVVDEEISIGDFVLTGGELPAQVLIDATIRYLPGVLGNAESAATDSLGDGLLKYAQYTRPPLVEGLGVPEILLGGHHAKIAAWRHTEKLKRTELKRPDLYRSFLDRSHPLQKDRKKL